MKYIALGILFAAAVLWPWRAGVSRAALEPGVLTAQVDRRAQEWESRKVPPSARVVDIVISDAETAALEDMLPPPSDKLSAWDSQALTLADSPSLWKAFNTWFRRTFLRSSMAAPRDTLFARSFADDPDAVSWTHEGFASASEAEMAREIGRAAGKAVEAGARVNIVTQGISAAPALRALGALKGRGKGARPAVAKFVAVDMNTPTLQKFSPEEFAEFSLPENLGEWAGVWTSGTEPETATLELYSAAYRDGTRFSCTEALAALGVQGQPTSADVIWLVKSLIKKDLPLEQVQLYLQKVADAKARGLAADSLARKHREDFAMKKAKKSSSKPEDSLSAINSAWLAKEGAQARRKEGGSSSGGTAGPGVQQEGVPGRTGWENYDEKCGKCCADAGGTWDGADRRHCCAGADYDYEVPSCRVTWVDKGGRSHDCAFRMGCKRPN